MELIAQFINIVLHLDRYLDMVIQNYGTWTYLILFVIIFCETGLVVTPILPGDSLLFVAGALSSRGSMEVSWLFALLSIAAVAGNTVNYQIGHFTGPKVFQKEEGRFLKKEYLERTHRFYERYGGITIILARFIPIIRTFAPFLAGVGRMTYWRFACYNIVGSLAWVSAFVFGGYFFGNIPAVRDNFVLVIAGIIVVSMLPTVITFVRERSRSL